MHIPIKYSAESPEKSQASCRSTKKSTVSVTFLYLSQKAPSEFISYFTQILGFISCDFKYKSQKIEFREAKTQNNRGLCTNSFRSQGYKCFIRRANPSMSVNRSPSPHELPVSRPIIWELRAHRQAGDSSPTTPAAADRKSRVEASKLRRGSEGEGASRPLANTVMAPTHTTATLLPGTEGESSSISKS